jgi:hypothetical protein
LFASVEGLVEAGPAEAILLTMICPHCGTAFFEKWVESPLSQSSPPGLLTILWQNCPSCKCFIVKLRLSHSPESIAPKEWIVHPKGASRTVPPEVPDPYKQDFIEACLVLPDSEKASAALSRRCVQVISSGRLPSHITEGLHAVRMIGNFAAHPTKSTSTGTIVEIEAGEAEWTLDVLEGLFDFFFVQPALTAKRKTELNKKLKDAGKPEIT